MKSAILPLLLGLFAASPLLAQDAGDDEPRKTRGRTAWFAAAGIPDDLDNPVDVMLGKEIVQVTLSRRSPSEPVKIPEDGIIRIVRRTDNPDGSSKPFYLTLAQARIPDSMSKALIILIPQSKEGSPQVFVTKVQSLSNFKGGDTLYLNLTTMNVAVQLGSKKLALKPGSTNVYQAPALSGATNTPVSYHYFHPTQEKWKLLSASTIVMIPTRREICIFSWDERYQRVNYHGITFPVTP